LSPTVTVTVVALATVGYKCRSETIAITTAAIRSERVFIALIPTSHRELQKLLQRAIQEK
ncbi:MAG TPA: hypothetical protein VIU10_06505, partial [Candidatus Udaeobacter sp.]